MSVAMGLLPTKGLTLPVRLLRRLLADRLHGRGGAAALGQRRLRGARCAIAGGPHRARERRLAGGTCVRVLIAGGGTGATSSPASRWPRRSPPGTPRTTCSSSAPRRGLEARVVPAAGFQLETIDVARAQGHGAR